MILKRCPWCGEKCIRSDGGNIARSSFLTRMRYRFRLISNVRCKSCHNYMARYRTSSKFSLPEGVLLLLFGLVIFISIKLADSKTTIIPLILCLVALAFVFLFAAFRGFKYDVFIKRKDRYGREEIPFVYSFKAKIQKNPDVSVKNVIKKQLYNNVILQAQFSRESKEKYPVVFDEVEYTPDGASFKAGFITDERIDKSFLKPDLDFTVINDDGVLFAKGKVTEIIQSQTPPPVKTDSTEKRKSWKNPDYFN